MLKELHECYDLSVNDGMSRRSLKRARASTEHAKIIRTVPVQLHEPTEPKQIHCVDPIALLTYLAREVPCVEELLKKAVQGRPCTPNNKLSLIIYSDAVSPGNQLKHDNKRKTQAVYWSIKEFGPEALGNEDCWFLLTVMRSNIVNRLSDGMSEFMTKTLNLFFEEPHSLHSNGLNLQLMSGGYLTIYASVSIMVSDEPALKASIGFKGSSGSKICALCQNVVAHSSSLDRYDAQGFLVSSAETDIRKFALCTDELFFETVDFITAERGRLGKTAFKKLKQTSGFNCKPNGLLMSPTLRPLLKPCSMLMYDWTHVYLVGGVFNHEVGLLLNALKTELNITNTHIHTFVAGFTWPKRLRGSAGQKVFEKRSGDGELKRSASEGLSVFSILRQFLQRFVLARASEQLKLMCTCYFALCQVLDLLRKCSRGNVTPHQLHSAIKIHLEYYKDVHGLDEWFPKMHYSLHLGMQLEKHECLISCFVHERKRKEIKRWGNNLSNTSASFEQTIVEECLNAQLQHLRDTNSFIFQAPHLINPVPCSPALLLVMASLNEDITNGPLMSNEVMYGPCQRAFRGDVVLFNDGSEDGVGQVVSHVMSSGHVLTFLRRWIPRGMNTFSTDCQDVMLVQSGSIKEVCAYTLSNEVAIVIPP